MYDVNCLCRSRTEANGNKRWKTESNGEPFTVHPGAILRSEPFLSVLVRSPQPIICECAHPFGSAGNAFQPEFWEYWEY
ncbi:MAG: hypothetical protein IJW05_00415 [Lentisphaeria bacterium]|nr:hypothetical protein [Lentisphaeria bacterium]